ncbi:hypothetical protein [uncultured Aquincola sp.]|uniref:hypothetical protein n=1 Tax=uncultured Aquincola sp. TaxID=886556 RepID=UPI0032B12FC8
MQDDTATVTVYSFMERGPGETKMLAVHKAARATILASGGQVLEGTAHKVPVDELDGRGFWCRLATGWGALPAA